MGFWRRGEQEIIPDQKSSVFFLIRRKHIRILASLHRSTVLSRSCLQLLYDLEILLVNSLSDLLRFMFLKGSQKHFLLINRNNIIGDSKENLIFFLDMVLQEPEVYLCLIDKDFLCSFIVRLRESKRRQHRPYVASSFLMLYQHHTDWTSVARYAALLHGRK